MKGNASPFPMEMWYFTVTEDREAKLKLCALKYRRKYKNPEPGCGGQESGNSWPPALGSIFFQPLANTTNCCYINEERYLSVRYHCLEIIQGQLEGTWVVIHFTNTFSLAYAISEFIWASYLSIQLFFSRTWPTF